MEPKQPFPILHRGPLTERSFDVYGLENVFRPARTQVGDELSILGWEVVPGVEARDFTFAGLSVVTAEGSTVLAATVDALRGAGSAVFLHGDINNVPGFGTVARTRTEAGLFEFREFADTLVLPVRYVALTALDDCWRVAREISSVIAGVSHDDFTGTDLAEAVELTLREILANIHTHSRSNGCYVCATIQRASNGTAYSSGVERTWLEARGDGSTLEIAVSDTGCGVPYHLARAYVDHERDLWHQIQHVSSRSTNYWALRAQIHERICRWAFAHDSTSKRAGARVLRESLNWRGLHRAFNYVTWESGSICLRSGQARIGIAASGDLAEPLGRPTLTRAEYPGTTIVIRFPAQRPTAPANVPRTPREQIAPAKSLLWRSPRAVVEAFAMELSIQSATDRELEYAVVHSDLPLQRSVQSEESVEAALEAMPGNVVSLHLFSGLGPAALASLLAKTPHWTPNSGVPRLLCCWDPTRGTSWAFAGVIPAQAEKAFATIVRDGTVAAPLEPAVEALFRELSIHYPKRLLHTAESWQIAGFDFEPEPDFLARSVSTLLVPAVLEELGAIYDAGPHRGVRTSGRTLVRRYLSATALVENNPYLRGTLSFLLRHQLKQYQNKFGDIVITSANLASYYLLRMLTREIPHIRVRAARPADTSFAGNCVVFVNAVKKGVTLGKAAGRIRHLGGNVVGAIAVLDLREEGAAIAGPPISPLFATPFDPIDLESSQRIESERAVCAVTDWPVDVVHDAGALTCHEIAAAISRRIPDLYRYGLQVVDSRIHPVTLPVRDMLEHAGDEVIDWLAQRIAPLALPGEPRQLVLFARRESAVYSIVDRVAKALRNATPRFGAILLVTLPAVPRGRRVIYALPSAMMFEAATELGVQATFFEKPVIGDGYVAVYLDSSAVTGATLRAFTEIVTTGTLRPAAVAAFPVVNRLGPSEESFLTRTARVSLVASATGGEAQSVPFVFASLFRLQVRSFDHIAQTGLARILLEFEAAHLDFDSDVNLYLASLKDRLRGLETELRAQELNVQSQPALLVHPFSLVDNARGTLSQRLVELRQLLALHQQNRGVLPVFLRTFEELVEEDQYGLLTIVAMELDLLDESPLALECWRDLMNLAIAALKNSTDVAVLSDAIVVLSRDKRSLVESVGHLVRAVVLRPSLLSQALAFLGLVLTSEPSLTMHARRLLDEMSESSMGEVVARFEAFARTSQSAVQLTLPTVSDALDSVYQLCRFMCRHSPAYNVWRDAARFFGDIPGEEPVRGWNRTIDAAVGIARTYLVPALLGLATIAREKRKSAAESEFRFAARRSMALLDSIEVEWARRPEARDMERLAANWLSVRAHTLTVTPDHFMSGGAVQQSYRPGVIEQYMPAFFCAPLEIVRAQLSIANDARLNSAADLPTTYEEVTQDFLPDYLAVAPVSQHLFAELTQILYQNYRDHGIAGSFRVGFTFTPEFGSLQLAFLNLRGKTEGEHSGRGLRRAKDVAELASLDMWIDTDEHDPVFRLYLLFPVAMQAFFDVDIQT